MNPKMNFFKPNWQGGCLLKCGGAPGIVGGVVIGLAALSEIGTFIWWYVGTLERARPRVACTNLIGPYPPPYANSYWSVMRTFGWLLKVLLIDFDWSRAFGSLPIKE